MECKPSSAQIQTDPSSSFSSYSDDVSCLSLPDVDWLPIALDPETDEAIFAWRASEYWRPGDNSDNSPGVFLICELLGTFDFYVFCPQHDHQVHQVFLQIHNFFNINTPIKFMALRILENKYPSKGAVDTRNRLSTPRISPELSS